MLGLSWTEMMIIGIGALIFIGPKDLPVVMNRVGKIVGQIRRMGSEFQREINKTTGLDEVRNLRNSITAPLKKTSDEIRREFNAMTPTGAKPSGIIKPADPKAESVVDEIKAQAGMPAGNMPADGGKTPEILQPAAGQEPVSANPAPTSPVTKTDLGPLEAVPAPAESQPIEVDKPVKKTPTRKAPARKVEVLPTEPADSPAAPKPKARAPRKPKVSAPDTTAKAGNE